MVPIATIAGINQKGCEAARLGNMDSPGAGPVSQTKSPRSLGSKRIQNESDESMDVPQNSLKSLEHQNSSKSCKAANHTQMSLDLGLAWMAIWQQLLDHSLTMDSHTILGMSMFISLLKNGGFTCFTFT
jgi:hypothetical protein